MRVGLARWLRAALSRCRPGRPEAEGNGSAAASVWCVVANVTEHRRYGVGGTETRRGLKHFPL
jgi:hypothetical protein